MPQELLTRIVALACADDGLSAEQLFRLGGTCRALRRACGSVDAAADPMAATWARAIIALVDPAAAVLAAVSAASGGLRSAHSCYLAHARALQGWYPLAHALADRECVQCGAVTRALAWRHESSEGCAAFGLCRCCADCKPPDASKSESRGFSRCAVLNQQFWTAVPVVVLNSADWEHPLEKLLTCIDDADDGDTIGLRGMFHGAEFGVGAAKAVRLLGMPDATPYSWVHAAGPDDTPGARMAQLRRFEQDSAAALGFPSASIHVERNCFEACDAVWMENIYISSGPRNMGTVLPGEHEHAFDLQIVSPSGSSTVEFSGLCLFQDLEVLLSPSAVLRRCWLTGYFGAGLVLQKEAMCCAALLRCVITNTRCWEMYLPSGTSLRMRGCRMMCSLEDQLPAPPRRVLGGDSERTLTNANHIFQFAQPASLSIGAPVAPVRVTRSYSTGFNPRNVRLMGF